MQNEQHEKLNRLLGRQGSIAERDRITKELDDDKLQTAAQYSQQAKEELERRRAERALHTSKRWYTRPVGIMVLGVVASLLAWAILHYFGLV